MKNIKLVLALSASTILCACGGGGGASSPPQKSVLAGPGGQVAGGGAGLTFNGVNFTHSQVAIMFLSAINVESANQTSDQWVSDMVYVSSGYYDAYGTWVDTSGWIDEGGYQTVYSPGPVYTSAKVNTMQSGYMVVGTGGGSYQAIYIDGWSPSNTDPMGYSNTVNTFSGLTFNAASNSYTDPVTGIVFQASQPTSNDLEKMVSFTEAVQIKKSALALQGYGFSEDRSLQVARLASQVKKSPQGSMTDADYDNFSKQLIGSSITQLKAALASQQQGDASTLDNIISTAAATNGVGPEQMKQMLSTVVGHMNAVTK